MFGTDLKTLVNFGQTYLAIRIGQMRFSPLDTCILVLALSAALLAAFNLWRMAKCEDRQRRLLDSLHRAPLPGTESTRTTRPRWYQQLGTTVAATRIIGAARQKRLLASLLAAGMKGDGHLATLIAGKACSGAAFVPVCWLLLEWRQFFLGAPALRLVLLAGAFILGWRCPEIALSRLAARRRVRLETGIPDALDLLVICVQAGLSLDHAVEQVSAVLSCSNRDVAEEFAATAAEMRVSAVRGQALENLAQRTGLMSLRNIVAALSQSIKFGTPLAEALRVLASQMRVERLARFEERAARLPVLLTMPLMAFILPSLMIVIGTPLVLRIVDALERGP
jgi:tight adherence protein C